MTPAMSIPQHSSMMHSSLRRSFGHRHSVPGGSPQLDLAPADSTASQDMQGEQGALAAGPQGWLRAAAGLWLQSSMQLMLPSGRHHCAVTRL